MSTRSVGPGLAGGDWACCGGRAVASGRGPVVQAAAVLRRWDERRAAVYARGDLGALRELYVDGAGAEDVRLLRRYVDRGYRVEGMRTQLLAVDVVARRSGRWRLRVTDRLVGAVAVRPGERILLPHDRPDTRMVTLVRNRGAGWQVLRVRPVRES